MNAAVLPDVVSGRFVVDMPEEEYHAHPALSASGMKNLLRSPKHFRAARALNKPKAEFDVGHAVHALVLGVGAPIVEIPGGLLSDDGGIRTKAAKEFVADARLEGRVPLKPVVFAQISRAAEAVLSNEKARALLEEPGHSEVSLFAEDPHTGVALRGRLDRLVGVRPIDVKTTTDVRRRNIERVIVDYSYDVQAAVYRHLVELVLGEQAEPMHLIFTEKDAPYEVRVVRLSDPVWQEGGERRMRTAIDLFAWCTEQASWPGDDEDGGPIEDFAAPGWYSASIERELV